MIRAGVQHHLESLMHASLASLRVVGLAYAGLGGMLALGLVISVAFMPVAPALEQVTQPARQMAAGLAPGTDAVVNLIGGPGLTRLPTRLFVPPPVLAAAAPGEGDNAVADTLGDEEQLAAESPPTLQARPYVGGPLARTVTPVADDESLLSEDEAGPIGEPEPRPLVGEPVPAEQPVAPPVERHVLQTANEAPAKPLPPLSRPTETPLQLKARVDAENQAAIDAAKAAQVRAKLEADVANQSAIDARQASEAAATAMTRTGQSASAPAANSANSAIASEPAAATPVALEVATVRPTDAAVPLKGLPAGPAPLTAGPQSRAVADASNQAVIDANKSSQARAKAQSNEANQSAIDTGKAARSPSPVRATPVPPTTQPTLLPTSTPAPTAVAIELETAPGPVVEMLVPTGANVEELSPDDPPPPTGSDDA